MNDAADKVATKGVDICKRELHYEQFVNEMNEKLTWTMTALDRQLLGGREYANTRFGSEDDYR